MPRFSLRNVLSGMTFTAIGLGMLAYALNDSGQQSPQRISLATAFLIAFGGAIAGYGVAFPVRPLTYRLILAMVGMFAAQAWQSGTWIGLLFYVGGLALLGVGHLFKTRLFSRNRRLPEVEHGEQDNIE